MKKSILIIFGCVISVFLFQAFSVTDRPQYKNLKILPNDITENDLDSIMHHFTRSLGQKCNFCHVRNQDTKKMDFPSDEKPEKKIARQMMQLAIDINKNYFAKVELEQELNESKMNSDVVKKVGAEETITKPLDSNPDAVMLPDSTYWHDTRYMLMEVNCNTCHRGNAHPDSKLPPAPEQ
ncbi:MAG: c-type cytochrome [Ginsengibacter sp.]